MIQTCDFTHKNDLLYNLIKQTQSYVIKVLQLNQTPFLVYLYSY